MTMPYGNRLTALSLIGFCFAMGAPLECAPRLDWEAIADRLVRQLDPQPGERVLLAVKGDQWAPLLNPVLERLAARGAVSAGVTDTGAITAEEVASRRLLENLDAMLILPGPAPADPLYAAAQAWLKTGRGRTVHFHWAGAYPVADGDLPAEPIIDDTYQRSLLQTDYEAVGEKQREFARALRRGEVRVTTPLGTDLRFRVGNRPVTLQDGDASARRAERAVTLIDREIELPCGAIRVAPLEESVRGVIAFPDSVWGGEPARGLRLRFEDGEVVDVQADSGADAVRRELDGGGPAARSFREFALGFNPTLAVPKNDPWIPYYGYGAGVVRLSLGDNSELGGKVRGPYVRWNFFTDATVSVDGEVWVRKGELIR